MDPFAGYPDEVRRRVANGEEDPELGGAVGTCVGAGEGACARASRHVGMRENSASWIGFAWKCWERGCRTWHRRGQMWPACFWWVQLKMGYGGDLYRAFWQWGVEVKMRMWVCGLIYTASGDVRVASHVGG